MNGVTMPCVSAGSNQVGDSETWMPQVNSPAGAAARPMAGMPTTIPSALAASSSRRVRPKRCSEPSFRASSDNLITYPPVLVFADFGRSRPLERDVLVGRGIGEARNQLEAAFADPRPDPVEEAQQPDRGV